jgi:Flp pilus assembly protein TadG
MKKKKQSGFLSKLVKLVRDQTGSALPMSHRFSRVRVVEQRLRGLWTDTDGIILPYVSVLLIVIIGMSALAVDGARYVSLQTQLQNGADQLALAAAAELNGKTDSITRANAALTTTLASFQQSTLFGTTGYENVTIASRYYLSELPAGDQTYPIPSSLHVTEDATGALQAHFIEVTVTPVTIPTIFPVSFFGGSTFPANATAVAGFNKNVCEFTPMYVCNPYEAVGNTDYDAATQLLIDNDVADPNALGHRQMITMRRSPGDFTVPGNYGFLRIPGGHGLGATRDAIAKIKPGTCLNASAADSQTGLGGDAMAEALNVRFDIYQNSQRNNKNQADYAPAPNVRKGYTYITGGPPGQSGPCNASPAALPTDAMKLPTDLGGTPPVGNGLWDFNTYWSVEHPGVAAPNGWSNTPPNLPSRYSVYNYEIATTGAGGLMDRSGNPAPTPPVTGEIGAPACSTETPPAPADRRIIQAAILNCQALNALHIFDGGHDTNIPIAAFGKFFTLHPADNSTGNFNAEFTGLARTSDEAHPPPNTVQLYR